MSYTNRNVLIVLILLVGYLLYKVNKLESKNVEGMANINGINTEALATLSSMYNDGKLIVKDLQVTNHADINNVTWNYGRTLNGLWFGPNSGKQRYIAPGGGGYVALNNAWLDITEGGVSTSTVNFKHGQVIDGNTNEWLNINNTNVHVNNHDIHAKNLYNSGYPGRQLVGKGDQFTLHNQLWNMPMGVCGKSGVCGGTYYKPVLGPVNGKKNTYTGWSMQ